VSCGCSGGGTSRTSQRASAVRIAAIVVIAWLAAKREWGLLVVAVGAFVAYRASTRPKASPASASNGGGGSGPPSGFSTGTDNVEGVASPTTTVEGVSPTITGDCS